MFNVYGKIILKMIKMVCVCGQDLCCPRQDPMADTFQHRKEPSVAIKGEDLLTS